MFYFLVFVLSPHVCFYRVSYLVCRVDEAVPAECLLGDGFGLR